MEVYERAAVMGAVSDDEPSARNCRSPPPDTVFHPLSHSLFSSSLVLYLSFFSLVLSASPSLPLILSLSTYLSLAMSSRGLEH